MRIVAIAAVVVALSATAASAQYCCEKKKQDCCEQKKSERDLVVAHLRENKKQLTPEQQKELFERVGGQGGCGN